jgi:hypothetical protein
MCIKLTHFSYLIEEADGLLNDLLRGKLQFTLRKCHILRKDNF